MRKTASLAGAALLVTMTALAGSAAGPPFEPVHGPGCDPSRPSVAHFAGGVPIEPQPWNRPTPCGVSDGMPGGESRQVVTNAGTVLYYPAQQPLVGDDGEDVYVPNFQGNGAANAALARTVNQGESWSVVRWPQPLNAPSVTDYPLFNINDSQMYVDRASGVILTALYDFFNHGYNNPMMRSTDDGKTWTPVIACCGWAENPEFTSAPPPPGGDQPETGYPHVIYFCHNVNGTFQVPPGRACNKSLDGGQTWGVPQGVTQPDVPGREECGGPGALDVEPNWDYPQGAPDGSLYLLVSCATGTFLARSTDEAKTWPTFRRLPHGGQLRVDGDGALYLARTVEDAAGSQLMLARSADKGATWGTEMNVLPPQVRKIPGAGSGLGYGNGNLLPPGAWDVTATRSGEVAFAYWSQRADGKLDGYITQTRNAGSRKPTFFSGMVNRPDDHLTNGAPLDFLSVDIGPDGTAWGSFVRECRPRSPDAVCTNPTTNNLYVGFSGRLAWPGPAAASPSKAARASTAPVRAPSAGAAPTQRALPATGLPLATSLAALVLIAAAGTVALAFRRFRGDPRVGSAL